MMAYDAANNTATLDGYKDTTQRSSGIISYDLSGEFETGGIVHNLIAGILNTSTQITTMIATMPIFLWNNNSDSDTAVFNIADPINIFRWIWL